SSEQQPISGGHEANRSLIGAPSVSTAAVPSLLTAGRIADELGVSLQRVAYILASRRHITPVARAGTLRLFDRNAVAKVRHELNAIDAKQTRRVQCVAHGEVAPV